MFKRFKNWLFSPAEDHAVASFAWFGLSYLALGAATAFPVLAPVAYGTAALASKVGVLEGIITGAHVVNNILSWGLGKIFGKKSKQPTPNNANPSVSERKLEKSHDQEHQAQHAQEKQKIGTKENPQPTLEPTIPVPAKPEPKIDIPVKQPINIPTPADGNGMPVQPQQPNMTQAQLIQIASAQLMVLMKQIKTLEIEIKQIRMENRALDVKIRNIQQENLALRSENLRLKQLLKQQNKKADNRHSERRVSPKKGLVVHNHYICNGCPVHE